MYFLIVSQINLFRQSFVASREKDAFNKKLKMVLGETLKPYKISKAIRHLYTSDPPFQKFWIRPCYRIYIILPAKSRSDVMFCLQSYGTYLS